MTFTGYELANYGSNEGTDAGGEDFDNIVIIFCFWVILKFGYVRKSYILTFLVLYIFFKKTQ